MARWSVAVRLFVLKTCLIRQWPVENGRMWAENTSAYQTKGDPVGLQSCKTASRYIRKGKIEQLLKCFIFSLFRIWPYCQTTSVYVLVVIYLLLAFGKYNHRQRVKEVCRLENIQLIRMMHYVGNGY